MHALRQPEEARRFEAAEGSESGAKWSRTSSREASDRSNSRLVADPRGKTQRDQSEEARGEGVLMLRCRGEP